MVDEKNPQTGQETGESVSGTPDVTTYNPKNRQHEMRKGNRPGESEGEPAAKGVSALHKLAEDRSGEFEAVPMSSKGIGDWGQPSVGVKVLSPREVIRPDGRFYIVGTVDGPPAAYLVPVESIELNFKRVQQVDTSRLIQAYDWKAEIEAMIPDLETVRNNVLMSFWRAGAIDRASLDESAVRSALFNNAYPYKLPED